MSPRIVINGQEVESPLARGLITALGLVVAAGLVGLVVVLVLGLSVWLAVLGLGVALVGGIGALISGLARRLGGGAGLSPTVQPDPAARREPGEALEPDEWRREP